MLIKPAAGDISGSMKRIARFEEAEEASKAPVAATPESGQVNQNYYPAAIWMPGLLFVSRLAGT
jgi:hypothetical protein